MGQRIYTVTLTVNNGIKDTSLTKLHYIHTDTYPSFLLNTTLVKNFNGEEQNINLLKYKSINMFENIVRTDSGDNYLKMVAFETSKGFVSGTQIDMCNVNYEIYKIQDNGYIGTNEYFHTPQSRCFIRSGVVGILHNSLISFYMYDQIPRFSAYILNEDLNNTIVKYPYFGLYNRVRPLNNTIDCFAFRDVLDFSRNLTILCFYIDTTKLLTKDSIIGYALPAVETSNNTFLSVVSPLTFDSVESRKIQIRRYNSSGIFFDSTVIYRLTFDFIYDIIRIPNNRYMLCGTTNISSKEVYGLILIMDENGTVEYSKSVPQWKKLKRITRMDDNTYAITGTPYVGYPGFIAVKSDGKIVGDFRANFTRTTSNTPDNYDVTVCNDCVDVSFGKTMKTVFFTRNNGYDAELYISDNPYLKDINVSVKEEQQMELPQSNSLVLAPNPTDGITTMQYLSTTQQKITITISTVLGELYYNEEIEVAAGKNDIQLDMSRFGSGVAFIGVSDKTSVLHGQIHVFR